MRVHRMISILLLIEAKGKVKAKELAEELETSVRTIYRDVDALCEAGIPLTTNTGPNGGIHFLEGYTVGIKNLNGEDIINLYLNGMGVKADKQSDMAMKVNSALLKFQKNMSTELNKDLNTVRKRFYVDDIPWWGEKRKLHNIDTIIQAVWQSKKLRITYKKHGGETTKRDIRPYGIVINEMNWYMIAYCEQSNDIRTFKCERITECQCQIEKFIVPENFSVEESWKKSKKLFISECSQSEKYPVTIRIDKHRVSVLKNYEIYEIKEDINYIEATINMFKYEFAKDDILEIIGYVEVLKPAELRNYVEEELSNILRKYNQGIL
jgi:predicted DNA-binding transcriptional regulator YafY